MKICAPPRPMPMRTPPPSPQEPSASGWDTFKKSAHFVAGGAIFKTAKFVGEAWQNRHGLEDAPKVTLDRPVVFVPGFTTPIDPYLPLVAHLTADGANGGQPYFVRDGQLYADPTCTQTVDKNSDPNARVFVVMPHTRYDTPPQFVAQLKPDVATINKFSNSSAADMVGYSMGGISSRLYLDQGGTGVGKLLMVGTPTRARASPAWPTGPSRTTSAGLWPSPATLPPPCPPWNGCAASPKAIPN